jgi:hypothetical protein
MKKRKTYELKKKTGNTTQDLAMEGLANWLMNDPDPEKTLIKIKKDALRKKSLSKNNPVKLMKEELTEEEYRNFWLDLADQRTYYAIEYYKKGKKIKATDFAQLYYLPQCVYNANFKYWKRLIKEYRYFDHPEFMVVAPENIEGYKLIEQK